MVQRKNLLKMLRKEEGNVLFLILIAVALFAALSYAVTSSTRSSGDASSETSLISSAQLTQYPSSVSTAIVRMVIGGTLVNQIRFNVPSEFSTLDSTEIGVFHPSGGRATYIQAPPDVMADNQPGDWFFNAELEVIDIGTVGAGGNDIIAYLPGLKESICTKINSEHGLGATIPELNANRAAQYNLRMVDDGVSDYLFPSVDVPDIDNGAGVFNGQPFGCFRNGAGGGEYVYYHVIVER